MSSLSTDLCIAWNPYTEESPSVLVESPLSPIPSEISVTPTTNIPDNSCQLV